MNNNMTDILEQYIKELFEKASENQIVIKRSNVAQKFDCVPSQLNYVIKTRFTPEHGFIIESKRGGGGYIRIGRIEFSNHHEMLRDLLYSVGEEVSLAIFEDVLRLLFEQDLVTRQEMNLLLAMATDRVLGDDANLIRANMLRQLLQEVDRKGK